jgi:hypothetical protein
MPVKIVYLHAVKGVYESVGLAPLILNLGYTPDKEPPLIYENDQQDATV